MIGRLGLQNAAVSSFIPLIMPNNGLLKLTHQQIVTVPVCSSDQSLASGVRMFVARYGQRVIMELLLDGLW